VIVRKLQLGTYASNCYIVASETAREAMVIDPGAEPQEILRVLKKDALTVSLIVLTHRHLDHVGAAARVKAATGAALAAHAECARYLPHSPSYVLPPGYEGAPAADRVLAGGDVINIADLSFTVIPTPGHTPCGISLYGEGHVFTGDTLFNYGIGRTDLVDADYDTILKSIKEGLLVLPPETIVHPGHGPDSTIATEIRANHFLK
jgi:hydroxyacylglutathione hydrolase